MSRFYSVQAIGVEPSVRKVVLSVEVKHPDYNILSDSIGYALDLVTDNLDYEETVFGLYVDADKMCNKNWIKENANRFIESCILLQSEKPTANHLLHGKVEIIFTHKAWMEHIKLHASWDSTAYEYKIENYKKCLPEIPNDTNTALNNQIELLKNVSIDYQGNDGWMPIKSSFLKGNMSKRSEVVYIPKYPFGEKLPSYVCDDFYSGEKPLKEMITVFDLKTVIIKDAHNGPNLFGVCVVQGNVVLIQTINERELKYTAFPLNRIKEIGLARYTASAEKQLDYKKFLENAKPN